MAVGWAVVESGKINIKTVSDTRRAAMVNWLHTEGHYFPTIFTSDEEIERAWWRHHGEAEVRHVGVELLNQ